MRRMIKAYIFLGILICFVILLVKGIYMSKVRNTYFYDIKQILNIDSHINIESIKKYKDKTDNVIYQLNLGEINGFDIYVKISNIDNILEPDRYTNIKVNIEDFEVAQMLYNKYGDKYKVVEVILCGYVNEEISTDSKYNGAYKFELENILTGNKVTGYIPSNKNLNEMFEVNEREDIDFKF